jgi:hypothetical protein
MFHVNNKINNFVNDMIRCLQCKCMIECPWFIGVARGAGAPHRDVEKNFFDTFLKFMVQKQC